MTRLYSMDSHEIAKVLTGLSNSTRAQTKKKKKPEGTREKTSSGHTEKVGAEKKNSKHGSAAGGSTPKTRVKGAVASKDSTIVDGDHTLVKVVDKEPPKPVRKMTRSTGQLRNGQREGDGDGVKEESRKEGMDKSVSDGDKTERALLEADPIAMAFEKVTTVPPAAAQASRKGGKKDAVKRSASKTKQQKQEASDAVKTEKTASRTNTPKRKSAEQGPDQEDDAKNAKKARGSDPSNENSSKRHLPRRFKGVVEAGDRFDVKVQLGSTGESVVEMMGFEDASDAARARDILVIKHTPKSSWSLNYPESSYASEIHSIQRLETTELQKRLRLGLRIDSKSARAEKAQSRHHKRAAGGGADRTTSSKKKKTTTTTTTTTTKPAEPQQPQPRYHGVSLCKGRYRAVVWFEGKNVSLGTSATPEEAARKHDVMVIKLFSPTDERLNFPPSQYSDKIKAVQALSARELQSRLRSHLPLEGPAPEFRNERSKCGYFGIEHHKGRFFRACFRHMGVSNRVSGLRSAEEAAKCYDLLILKILGFETNRPLNNPRDTYKKYANQLKKIKMADLLEQMRLGKFL